MTDLELQKHRATKPIDVLRVTMMDETLREMKPTVRLFWWVGDKCIHEEQFTLAEDGAPEDWNIGTAWEFVLGELAARRWPAQEHVVRYAQLQARAVALGARLIEGQGTHEIEMVQHASVGLVEVEASDFDEMETEVHAVFDRISLEPYLGHR